MSSGRGEHGRQGLLLSVGRGLALGAPVEADDDEVGTCRPRLTCVGDDPGCVDRVGGPGGVGRRRDAVESVAVGEVGDLGAPHVVDPGGGGLVGRASGAGVAQPVPVERVERGLDARSSLVERVVRRRRAAAVAGARDAGDQLAGRAEHRVSADLLGRRCERHLEMAERQVGARQDRRQRREHRCVFVSGARPGAEGVGRGVDRAMGQDVAGECQGDGLGPGRGGRRRRRRRCGRRGAGVEGPGGRGGVVGEPQGRPPGRSALDPGPDAADNGRAGERKAREPAASERSVSDAVCRHYR